MITLTFVGGHPFSGTSQYIAYHESPYTKIFDFSEQNMSEDSLLKQINNYLKYTNEDVDIFIDCGCHLNINFANIIYNLYIKPVTVDYIFISIPLHQAMHRNIMSTAMMSKNTLYRVYNDVQPPSMTTMLFDTITIVKGE